MGYVYNPFTSRIEYYEDPTEYKAKNTAAQTIIYASPGDGSWATANITSFTFPVRANVVVVDDNLVYSIGGHDGSNYIGTFKVYDPAIGWSSKPDLPEVRAAGGACLYGNKLLYFGGGEYGGPLYTSCLTWSSGATAWTTFSASMTQKRYAFGFASDGESIYAWCGWDESNTLLNSMEKYDGSSWSNIGTYPISAGNLACAYNRKDSKIYSIGGDLSSGDSKACYTLDPALDSWTSITDYPDTIAAAAAGWCGDGFIHVFGGEYGGSISTQHRYLSASGAWTSSTAIPGSARKWFYADNNNNGNISMVGGYTGSANIEEQDRWENPYTSSTTCYPIVEADEC